ncbi:Rrf2 family transcriptional regulator [Methylobacterium durans]|uniref:Rrf2 family transcriptional regulator n=1 Tax=Methylobacterium durans TaxID=2202825 RepID=A0A2U8W544_9HYPH|nr:Rrf2 family transcriptional regulator [Methylobacterium durans]AWN40406.1 Rrf2 family transcriptional regulator [Methylobacterium durans]MEA1831676.1 Rrf2 family transcriptional regulator [Methylobacterium durans]
MRSDPPPPAPAGPAAARLRLATAAVIDIALHARPQPVNARVLSARHGLPPRHLETVLQALVRHGLLKGVRGPRGGYELARERRRISVGDIARAAGSLEEEDGATSSPMGAIVEPTIRAAQAAFLSALDAVTVEDLCRQAEALDAVRPERQEPHFDI